METKALIETLATGLRPVSPHAVGMRLGIGAAAGVAVAAAFVALWLGFRPDLAVAIQGATFWMKWGYTAGLGIAAASVVALLARPDRLGFGGRGPLVALPVVILAAIAVWQCLATPASGQTALWWGSSWLVCPSRIFLVSLPIFAGLIWAIRGLAPTRLRVAGLAAGAAAGGLGATVYALHCPEVSACFVLVWYSLGVVLSSLLGLVSGPRLLRW